MTTQILIGDCRDILATLPDESVHCVVTSPPYWGLRDYDSTGQIGMETSPDQFVTEIKSVFYQVRRVLRSDGTLWLNLGDSYAGKSNREGFGSVVGLKPKDLCGMPWRVAFALQADGWYLRQDIIWSKSNPMPESVRDRCTNAHEYLFLLSKSERYYYDADAIREPHVTFSEQSRMRGGRNHFGKRGGTPEAGKNGGNQNLHDARWDQAFHPLGRNKRSIWSVTTEPFTEAHFATFPPALIEPCIMAGCPKGGTVLDPFFGAGTTGLVADRLGRNCIGIELNPEYAAMAERRIKGDAGMFSDVKYVPVEARVDS